MDGAGQADPGRAEPAADGRRRDDSIPGVLVAVTDHAAERFRQRVAGRLGELDPRAEIVTRVSRAWAAGRASSAPPRREDGRPGAAAAGTTYVRDLVDRDLVFVCRHDVPRHELIVVTLWEEPRLGEARVPRRFTDALAPRRRSPD
jgi:hypothetical protein